MPVTIRPWLEEVTLPALSLWQPQASLLACGAIRTEMRSWRPKEGGLLALHAGKSSAGRDWTELPAYARTMKQHGLAWDELPFGAVVGVAELWDIRSTDEWRGPHAAHYDWDFLDFGPGQWAWRLRKAQVLPRPVVTPGRQGVWTLPEGVWDAVVCQLSDELSELT